MSLILLPFGSLLFAITRFSNIRVYDTTSTTLIITAVLHADLTPQILRYNEEKDRKVIEYVEDWLSHIEWTNQDVIG